MKAHPPRARVLRAEALAQLARPDAARRAVLRDLLEEVDLRVEEEAQARREVVDVEAALDRLLDVGQPVLDRERELLRGGRAGLADVVARHADRVPARHLGRAPLDHVAAQAHRRVDGEAPLLLGDVLLEDVRLDRAAQPVSGDAVALGGGDVEREHDDGGRVDRHRDRDLAEVDAGEERLHVVERVDGDALAPDLALAQDVVGVVAHEARHVEGRAEAVLAAGEQVAEALVGLLGRAEARELAHRPQAPAVHRRVDAAREGIDARPPVVVLVLAAAGEVGLRVQRLDGRAAQRRERDVALGSERVRGAPLGFGRRWVMGGRHSVGIQIVGSPRF